MRKRHTLLVQPREKFKGSAGQTEYRNVGDPVEVRGNVHPLSAEEVQLFGDRAVDTRKFFYFGPSWPGDMFCEITFEGVKWDQVAPAPHMDLGLRTAHFEVLIRKR